MRTVAWLGATVLIGATTASGQEYPPVALPAPTGPHPIGTRVAVFVDSTRVERLLPDSGGPRRLRVRFWYPSEPAGGPTAVYMDAPTAATWVERHGFPAGFETRVRTHARRDVPLASADRPWPLLVFSHGMSWPASMYQAFHEEMASHGYVVAAVDHTGYSDAIVFPDGRVAGFMAWREPPESESEDARRERLAAHMPTWVADLRAALRAIERRGRQGEAFYRWIDPRASGAFGHSYGGGAAVRLMLAEAGVVAAANLEGSHYGADTLPFAVGEPLLHVVGGYNEADLVATEFAPDDAPLYEVVVHGAFHSTFSDLIYLHGFKADDAWHARHRFDLDPARAIRITNDHLLAFFDRFVKGVESEREDLLHLRSRAELAHSATLGYPEVELRVDY